MWNKKEMSQSDATLTKLPLTLTSTLTLDFHDQIIHREWEVRLSWNEREGGRLDALMWNTKEMSQLDIALTGVPLTLTFDLEFSRSNCILGMGGSIGMERKDALMWNTATMWPRYRWYCLGQCWLKMSAFPSTRLVRNCYVHRVRVIYKWINIKPRPCKSIFLLSIRQFVKRMDCFILQTYSSSSGNSITHWDLPVVTCNDMYWRTTGARFNIKTNRLCRYGDWYH